jgi:hypothetical protein
MKNKLAIIVVISMFINTHMTFSMKTNGKTDCAQKRGDELADKCLEMFAHNRKKGWGNLSEAEKCADSACNQYLHAWSRYSKKYVFEVHNDMG